MSLAFKNIPNNLRVPLFYAEVDGSRANSSQQTQRALIIGQKTSGGVAVANTPLISQGVDDAKTQGGAGSMLALMTAAYRAADAFGEVWYLPLSDNGAGVAATGTITFAGPTTAVGVYSLYVGGVLVSTALASGTTAAQAATAVAAAINANTDLPVTAAASSATVTLTARNKGENGNDIDLRHNYRGAAGGEVLPAGLTATIVAMASGATNPTLTTGLANLQDLPFDFIVSPFTDATSVAALTSFLNDVSGRWSWQVQIFGHVFMAYRGSFGSLTTYGTALNDPHTTCMGVYDSPTPNWIWAAAVAGAAANSLRADPAVPLQTLQIPGVLAPKLESRFSLSQRNTLLYDGISTFRVDQAGAVSIENLITTYQKNAFSQPDDSFLQVETLFTLAFLLRDLAGMVTTVYARNKLAADGTRVLPGSSVVTPAIIRASLIARYREREADGLVQQSDVFAANLVVQQNAQNPNRVDVLWPAIIINQLRIFALLAQFRLS